MSALELGIDGPGRAEADLGDVDLDAPFVDEIAADDGGGQLSLDTVRGTLQAIGLMVHSLIGEDGAGEEHWRFSSDELDDLAPAVLRIASRRPKLRQALEKGDELTVALILAGYFGRNIEATRVARKEHDDGELGREVESAPAATGNGARPDQGWSAPWWRSRGEDDGGGDHDDAPGTRGEG